MTAEELIEEVEAAGGRLALNGDKISYAFPDDEAAAGLVDQLREMKPDVIEILRRRAASMPWPGYHGGQPFVCAKCGMRFDTSAGYAKHIVHVCGWDGTKFSLASPARKVTDD